MAQNHRTLIITAILLASLAVAALLAWSQTRQRGVEPNHPASTHAPEEDSSYWDKERMESASPAPMPPP